MAEELEQFLDKLGTGLDGEGKYSRVDNASIPTPEEVDNPAKILTAGTPTQWLNTGDETYLQVSETIKKIPVGIYIANPSPMGILFKRLRVVTDDLINFKESRCSEVISGIRKFWNSKPQFKALGQIHKRGVLLHGLPGSGKTGIIQLLCTDLQSLGGMILQCSHPAITSAALQILRKIEPERPLICVMEDLDELVRQFGESNLLQLLDGENQVDNICFIATTNYPELLDKRFVNRPSRFDEIIQINMPNAESRAVYLRTRSAGRLTEEQVELWVHDTEGMSLAHLRELVVSVFCLDKSYAEVIARLKIMMKCVFSERKFGIEPLINGAVVGGNPKQSYTLR